jgi:hypothetical protein
MDLTRQVFFVRFILCREEDQAGISVGNKPVSSGF